jgi:CheY-like chemotaxis protein
MTITAAPSPVKSSQAFSILIVDDNRDFVEFLKFLLSQTASTSGGHSMGQMR